MNKIFKKKVQNKDEIDLNPNLLSMAYILL